MIAQLLGYTSIEDIFKVSIGALFHDIGKKFFDPALVTTPKNKLSPQQLEQILSHPEKGIEALSAISNLSHTILSIVKSHEDPSATSKLASANGLPTLEHIVASANEFCNCIQKTAGRPDYSLTISNLEVSSPYLGADIFSALKVICRLPVQNPKAS
jgi:hypothetical protein